jgi:hypothetical protein
VEWVTEPFDRWALLQIGDVVYLLTEVEYEESDGTPRLLIGLRKTDGTEYQLSPTPDGRWSCDCPDACFRPWRENCCKHCVSVPTAYERLDRQRRLSDWLDDDGPDAAA